MPKTLPQLLTSTRKLALACVALLLVLSLGLAAWPSGQDRPPPRARGEADDLARLAQDYLPGRPDAALSGTLRGVLAEPDVIPTHHHPLLGRPAPDFTLTDSEGKDRHLRDMLRDGPGVVIFYLGYSCVHCVRQLFDVHKDMPLFRETGAWVVAISADPPELTRQRFAKFGPFGFPVLADPTNKIARLYQTFRGEVPCHGTFLIDRDGTIRWVNIGDAPFRRNTALLYQLAQMQKG